MRNAMFSILAAGLLVLAASTDATARGHGGGGGGGRSGGGFHGGGFHGGGGRVFGGYRGGGGYVYSSPRRCVIFVPGIGPINRCRQSYY